MGQKDWCIPRGEDESLVTWYVPTGWAKQPADSASGWALKGGGGMGNHGSWSTMQSMKRTAPQTPTRVVLYKL